LERVRKRASEQGSGEKGVHRKWKPLVAWWLDTGGMRGFDFGRERRVKERGSEGRAEGKTIAREERYARNPEREEEVF